MTFPVCSAEAALRQPYSFVLCRTQWQHVVVAFLSGILVAYAFFTFRVSMCVGHPSLGLAAGSGQESPWGVLQPTVNPLTSETACSRPAVPRGFAMSLLALSRETGDPLAVPDKLIVAARHEDVSCCLLVKCRSNTRSCQLGNSH